MFEPKIRKLPELLPHQDVISPKEVVQGAQFEALYSDDGHYYPCTVESLTLKQTTAKIFFPQHNEKNKKVG